MSAESGGEFSAFVKGVQVWIKDKEEVWKSCELLDDLTPSHIRSKTPVTVFLNQDESSSSHVFKEIPHLKNPDILIGRDDLTTLSYLHEPAVLFNLKYRFLEQQAIYTYCGIVLVAINPYQHLPDLYGDEMIQVYCGVGKQVREMDPHIYAVAEEAFYDLKEFEKSQSLIVSGESGAGKTVSAKYAMRYFAALSSKMGATKTDVESRVLASNPIMEAIGNAKTIRNDNSSRFGKFIQIDFNDRFSIAGASMKTYLLEKSRVVFQASSERNYHIFYQMCAGHRCYELLKELYLGDCDSFHYTEGIGSEIPGVSDVEVFQETISAFDLLEFTKGEQRDIFRVLSGILHLGNIAFDAVGNDDSSLSKQANDSISILASKLYGCEEDELRQWLCNRQFVAGGNEIVRRRLSGYEAQASRDALSKMIYGALFNWIVKKINSTLTSFMSPRKLKQKSGKKEELNTFVGVLDIYGFETFDVNSFEQFCINYANEKLQQQFNIHVFKLEQEEYVREGIEWVKIQFYDNQPCIELIENKRGIVDILDEQCKLGQGTDSGWLNQMETDPKIKSAPHFETPKIKQSAFIIKHFASDVAYRVEGFLEKNRDTVSEQLVTVFKNSKFPFLDELLSQESEKGATPVKKTRLSFGAGGGGKQFTKTVASQFRESLRDLMTILSQTRPHYVRCIKPNDAKEAFELDPQRAIQQLRACGVLETVRISAAGYPSRWPFDEFARRYRILATNTKFMWKEKPKAFAEICCRQCIKDPEKFAVGKTKIFFRTGQVALLERLRTETLTKAAVEIQRIWRGYKARKAFLILKAAIHTMQAAGRAFIMCRRLLFIQMHRAAVCIQARVRGWQQQKRYQATRKSILLIQNQFRGKSVRQNLRRILFQKLVTNLQARCRGYLVRKRSGNVRKRIILAQSCVRRFLARKRLKKLKIEARSVSHLQKLNKGLENKIISLQQRLDASVGENHLLKEEVSVVQDLRNQVTELLKLNEDLNEREGQIKDLTLSLEESIEESRHILEDKEAIEKNTALKISVLEEELRVLRESNKTLSVCNDEMKWSLDQEVVKSSELEQKLLLANERADGAQMELESYRQAQAQFLENDSNGMVSPPPSDNGSSSPQFRHIKRTPSTASTVRPEEWTNGHGTMNGHENGIEPSWKLEELPILMKQQRALTSMREEKEHLESTLEKLGVYSDVKHLFDKLSLKRSLGSYEELWLTELNVTNQKLKNELTKLMEERAAVGPMNLDFQRLIENYMEEISRIKEENVQLRAILAEKFESESPTISNGINRFKSSDDQLEEELCWSRQCREQKKVIEELVQQLEDKDASISNLIAENMDLKEIRDQQKRFLENGLDNDVNDPGFQTMMHNELNRMVSENMLLQSKLDKQTSSLKSTKLKMKKMEMENNNSLNSSLEIMNGHEKEHVNGLSREIVEHRGILQITDLAAFIRILIPDLKPRKAALITPCLPSYLFLAGLKYFDEENDEGQLTQTFTSIHGALKDIVETSRDSDVLGLWLVNGWRLLNLLRQYSGDEEWSGNNSPKQCEMSFQNVDNRSLQEKLTLRVQDSYRNFMKRAVEPILSPKVVPAILQHESTRQILDPSPNGMRRGDEQALSGLLEYLGFVHSKLVAFGADHLLLQQIFGQILSWISALSINHLMFRRELCNFERAFEIKHNITEIMSWLEGKNLGALKDRLEPVVQATHLLQSRKDEENLDILCGEMTSKLKPKQIVTLLRHYTSSDHFEDRLSPEFLAIVVDKLERSRPDTSIFDTSIENGETPSGGAKENPLMMETYLIPMNTALYVHSDVALERLSLPPCLRLDEIATFI